MIACIEKGRGNVVYACLNWDVDCKHYGSTLDPDSNGIEVMFSEVKRHASFSENKMVCELCQDQKVYRWNLTGEIWLDELRSLLSDFKIHEFSPKVFESRLARFKPTLESPQVVGGK